MIAIRRAPLLAALAGSVLLALGTAALAQGKTVASVNGKPITEEDLKLADAEIGSDLGNLPEATRRRVLIEYVIENQLFAEAAEAEKLASGAEFDQRMAYFRRRALRETYFDKSVRAGVTEADARKVYDAQIGGTKGQEEVKARHILVESEAKAKELAAKLAGGDESAFAELAKANSRDPGTRDDGGALGFFGRGQMVPQFEEAAFKLKKGEISSPVQTQFGWHIIRVDERRSKQSPEFALVRDRIIAALLHQRAQAIAGALREKAKLEFHDPEIKQQIEAEQGAQPKKQ